MDKKDLLIGGNTKLNIEQVKKIRKKYKEGISIKKLSNNYNVSYSTIWDIIKKRTWKEI